MHIRSVVEADAPAIAEIYAPIVLETAISFERAFAGIALPNAGSVALHESVGYRALGVYEKVGFKFGQWRDVGWWQKELQPQLGEPRPPRTPGG